MGAFQFACPQCGKMLEGEDALSGKVATCPFCGNRLTVPRNPASVPPAAPVREAVKAPVRLNRYPGMKPVAIIPGESDADVLQLVEQAALQANPQRMMRSYLGAWSFVRSDVAERYALVHLGIRQFTLHVCYRIEDGKLVPDVPFSESLGQTEAGIHTKAFRWVNDFSERIRNLMFAKIQSGDPSAETAAPPVAAGTPRRRFCEECGAPVKPTAKFCSSCGHRL